MVAERKPPQSAGELLERYAAGEREFWGARLREANLAAADLSNVELWRADLTGANLEGARLHQADLHEAVLDRTNLYGGHLCSANLTKAALKGADLSRADVEQALFDAVRASGVNLRETFLMGTSFLEADLSAASISGADLSGADLSGAELRGADLSGVVLTHARLAHADLSGADLSRADLSGANLFSARLAHATLVEAILVDVNLARASLLEANVGGARIGRTVLAELDISPFCVASPPVRHSGASYVDAAAVALSWKSNGLEDFLRHAGLPGTMAESMVDGARRLSASEMRSTYLSYGHPDQAFARKVYDALQGARVRCFFFPEHATPGEKLHRTIRKGILEHDRVILVCSRASLNRAGVLFEIEEILAREAKMKGETLLIPIRLDRYVLDGWKPEREDMAEAVRSRVVADFEGADQDEDRFQAGLRRLLTALAR
ncbi:toll/interleukin-1 receptor domain-containing protein [Sorangium sp. So ce260]|uniref:pentapeptide repeat-containing protein n=1 Tax=Sorangium sp. So ce260 TaxID=3133291 RepID=UPI003F605F88